MILVVGNFARVHPTANSLLCGVCRLEAPIKCDGLSSQVATGALHERLDLVGKPAPMRRPSLTCASSHAYDCTVIVLSV
jgi:hypothetical protein